MISNKQLFRRFNFSRISETENRDNRYRDFNVFSRMYGKYVSEITKPIINKVAFVCNESVVLYYIFFTLIDN